LVQGLFNLSRKIMEIFPTFYHYFPLLLKTF